MVIPNSLNFFTNGSNPSLWNTDIKADVAFLEVLIFIVIVVINYKDTKVIFLCLINGRIINNWLNLLKKLRNFPVDVFQETFVFRGKGIRGVGVDIYLPDILVVYEQRNHDFCLYGNTTCDIIVLGGYIGYYEVLVGNGHLTTDALSKRDNGMVCRCARIGSQFKFLLIAISKVKPYPIIIGDGFL